jgi:hypothetical protein
MKGKGCLGMILLMGLGLSATGGYLHDFTRLNTICQSMRIADV